LVLVSIPFSMYVIHAAAVVRSVRLRDTQGRRNGWNRLRQRAELESPCDLSKKQPGLFINPPVALLESTPGMVLVATLTI